MYFLYTNVKMGYHNIQYSWDIRQLQQRIRTEHHRQMVLKQKLVDVQKEPYIEQQARTVLGLVKQGEIAYQIINEQYDRNNNRTHRPNNTPHRP